MSRDSLFDAIRASIATPTIFRPYRYHGRMLVDGGLLNPVPVSATLRDLTDCTIAVDVNALAEPLDSETTIQTGSLPATHRASLVMLEDDRGVAAEKSSGRKTRLLNAAPHDIRHPVNTIDLMAKVIRRTAEDPALVTQVPQMARRLQSSARSLVALVSEVLDIAHLEQAGRGHRLHRSTGIGMRRAGVGNV